ncbi:helix-turn-helix transcriptional regulator [Nocardioides panaciterrulae]|uniref:Putative ArsR family transcriptional regulator n=1 Tax=Nocardioides panaciterrulae TaxID=661492 RepID=A0A7Y9E448_9ACTN|nr:putative ArsR family transcriptional regulator [Nocardioides panaciterrulae]
MENKLVPPSDLGPRPARPASRPGRTTRSRTALLELLEAQPEPTTLAALAASTRLHPNTVREHLEGLEAEGFVERHRAAPDGRGRPAWLYAATAAPASPEYAGLAVTLASAIHRTSPDPAEDAAVAGAAWGHDLARDHGRPDRTGAVAARREVVALLDEVGFAPEADARANQVRLTRCPLLEAAHRHPDVVCNVHLGLVRGALDEYDAPGAEVTLVPFAEPGACRLAMHHRRGERG